MKSFFEWFSGSFGSGAGDWLLLGKGPSFARHSEHDLARYRTLGLNHIVRELPITVAHMIDYDVVAQCGAAVETNASVLVMPWIPHVANVPGNKTLGELVHESPVLRRMDRDGRLLWYNLNTSALRNGPSPVVNVRFFSAEAALRLLALAGVRKVRSLGIDGGASYSRQFADLSRITLLSNGRASFDRQFQEIARIILETGVDYAPLDVETPIRVFVGATEAQEIPAKVLEYSIRKHASMSVEVTSLHKAGVDVPLPARSENRPRTPFTLQRFAIPEIMGFKGRAIYLDSDMQVFRDIRALWTMPFDGADLLAVPGTAVTNRRPQFAVMLLDCARLDWNVRSLVERLDRGEMSYEKLVHEMAVATNPRSSIDPTWNELDEYRSGRTALLHYTDMLRQPWVCRHHPYGHLWMRDLFEAVGCGFISSEEIREHVARGYLRPSLLYQLEHRLDESSLVPEEASRLDDGYVAPCGARPADRGNALRALDLTCRATIRRSYRRSSLSWLVGKLAARFQ